MRSSLSLPALLTLSLSIAPSLAVLPGPPKTRTTSSVYPRQTNPNHTPPPERRWPGMSRGEKLWVLCLHAYQTSKSPVPDMNDSAEFDKAVRYCADEHGDEWVAWNRNYVEHRTWDSIFPAPALVDEALE